MDLSALAASGAEDPPLAAALRDIGDPTGETWRHLLGICAELDEPCSVEGLVDHIAGMDAMVMRLVLLGGAAWSWRSIVGEETIDAAAAGDADAASRLLADDRYYGGVADRALPKLLSLDAPETQRRFVAALEAYRDRVGVARLAEPLAAAAARVAVLAGADGWIEAVEVLTGYRYLPEPEARRVVVMPYLAVEGLTLAQHHDARLIVYAESLPADLETRIMTVGKALADATRVQMLAFLGAGPMHLGELVDATGLTRSTVHHHLRQLRGAGLVSFEGNARAYRYRIDRRGRVDAVAALRELLGFPSDREETHP